MVAVVDGAMVKWRDGEIWRQFRRPGPPIGSAHQGASWPRGGASHTRPYANVFRAPPHPRGIRLVENSEIFLLGGDSLRKANKNPDTPAEEAGSDQARPDRLRGNRRRWLPLAAPEAGHGGAAERSSPQEQSPSARTNDHRQRRLQASARHSEPDAEALTQIEEGPQAGRQAMKSSQGNVMAGEVERGISIDGRTQSAATKPEAIRRFTTGRSAAARSREGTGEAGACFRCPAK
jgi:hypothetical protein